MTFVCRKLVLSVLTVALGSACADSPTGPALEPSVISKPRSAAISERIVESEVLWTNGNATAINDNGVIVGVQTINGAQKTVRWENGVLIVVAGIPDGFRPRTVTNDGRMLGSYANRPAIWTGTSFVQPQGPAGQYAWSFSNFSGVMGGSGLFNNFILPIRLDGSTVTTLQAPGFPIGGQVNDLNMAGQMVGVVGSGPGSRPFISINGALTILPVPPGTSNTVMHGINEDGEAIGYVGLAVGGFIPLKWKNGAYEIIPSPNPSAMGHAIGENNFLVFRDAGFIGANYYVYDGSQTTKLFSLASASVVGINRNGFMVGSTSGASPSAMRWRVVEKPVDNTAPVITSSVSGTQGQNGWYTSNVSVSWSVTDAESPVTSPACASTSVTADTQGTVANCSATSAGGTSSASISIQRDATAPSVSFSGAPTYQVNDVVNIDCTATDATSGIATSNCPDISGPAYSLGVGSHSVSGTATDNAGNSASASTTFTVEVSVAGVAALIAQWVSNPGVAKSLVAKLESIGEASGNSKAGKIGAFTNAVEAQRGKTISSAHADALIAMVQSL